MHTVRGGVGDVAVGLGYAGSGREAVDAPRQREPLRVEHGALRVVGVCTCHTGAVTAYAWAPDGSALVTASSDRTARIWFAEDWSCMSTLPGRTESIIACAWAPDGSALVTTSDDDTARVWGDI